jgi:ribosomal protein L40E
MSRIINFDNARRIQNCSNLCYINSGIHLLYSLVEFREKVYNTNFIPIYATNYIEQNKILYYLKYIFLLMNTDLTPSHDRYDVDDDRIKCERNQSKTSNNLFYNEIYYPFLKLIISNEASLTELESCGASQILFMDIIKKLSFISNNIFSFNPDFQVGSFDKTKMSITKFFEDNSIRWNDIQTYSIIHDDYTGWTESAINNYIKKKFTIKRGGNNYEYELIGCIISGRGHFWSYIKDSKFQKIDDIGKRDSILFDNISGNPYYLLYKQSNYLYVDKYPIKIQINNLANISNNIKSDNICKECAVENLPTATVCVVCNTSIIPIEFLNKIMNLNYSIIKKLINYRFNTVICSFCQGINKLSDKNCKVCTIDFSSKHPLTTNI